MIVLEVELQRWLQRSQPTQETSDDASIRGHCQWWLPAPGQSISNAWSRNQRIKSGKDQRLRWTRATIDLDIFIENSQKQNHNHTKIYLSKVRTLTDKRHIMDRYHFFRKSCLGVMIIYLKGVLVPKRSWKQGPEKMLLNIMYVLIACCRLIYAVFICS